MDALASLWAQYIFEKKRPKEQIQNFPQSFKDKVEKMIEEMELRAQKEEDNNDDGSVERIDPDNRESESAD